VGQVQVTATQLLSLALKTFPPALATLLEPGKRDASEIFAIPLAIH
jgi:hypothetical protein